jgi:hypothetical protein
MAPNHRIKAPDVRLGSAATYEMAMHGAVCVIVILVTLREGRPWVGGERRGTRDRNWRRARLRRGGRRQPPELEGRQASCRRPERRRCGRPRRRKRRRSRGQGQGAESLRRALGRRHASAVAPRAMRTPISLRRRATMYAMTPYSPSTASTPANSPKAPARAAIRRSRISEFWIWAVRTVKSTPISG